MHVPPRPSDSHHYQRRRRPSNWCEGLPDAEGWYVPGGYIRAGAEGDNCGDRLELGMSWKLDGSTRHRMGDGHWAAAEKGLR